MISPSEIPEEIFLAAEELIHLKGCLGGLIRADGICPYIACRLGYEKYSRSNESLQIVRVKGKFFFTINIIGHSLSKPEGENPHHIFESFAAAFLAIFGNSLHMNAVASVCTGAG